ncbi:MAG: hybrid sensor histidine kinase/response regulator [Proteobacteria bacterium SG_bin6]|nr:MAG: hybrid sensor histidine kinase/response regulator [Proteobacteria bacterium SG_bin6]
MQNDHDGGDSLSAPLHPSPPIEDHRPPHHAPADIFFAAVSTTRMPMIVTDPNQPDNPIIFCNEAFTYMSGYDESEIVGLNCRFLQGPETDREVVAQVRRAIEQREEVSVELLNYRKNGSTFWNALFVSPIYDERGELLYFFASQLDISRRREAEEALHQAQKMEAVGQLTGGIAHDFNNLLQVIIGYADMLEGRLDAADRPAQRALEAITSAANRGATLTQQLLAFARKQELRDRLLNFNTLVNDFRPVIERNLGEGLRLRTQLADELWNCRVDPVQAELALLNILTNARDATEGRGTVTITTRNEVIERMDARTANLEPGEYIVVEIADTGPGVGPEAIDKVFDPFFSTKGIGKGTGLGLAMVYGFMRQSNGLAKVHNQSEGGACFTLCFPRATGIPDRNGHAQAARRARAAERVLMVEDQAEVAQLGQALLEDLGYSVVHAANARAALDILAHDQDFALVFSDILMPGGMNGVMLAHQVRRDFPKLPILLTTGYSDEALDDGGRSFELLRKPYRRHDLHVRIRALLDRPGART